MSKLLSFLSALLVFLSVILAATGIFYSYSYWWDELYSVSAARMSLADLYQFMLLPDVHPPLYTLLLHYWTLIFGSEERIIRLFSFICAISSLLVLYTWSRKRFDSLFTSSLVIFFSTSWLFSFYAQEARSYAIMMLLSTIVTIMYLDNWHINKEHNKVLLLLACLISLSLTHYFGFIYAGLVLLFITFECRTNIKKILAFCLTGFIMFIWPINHFVNGSIGQKTGDNFWIKSDGFQSTISSFAGGVVPQLSVIKELAPNYIAQYIISVLVIVLMVAAIYMFRKFLNTGALKNSLKGASTKSIYLIITFILIIIGLDYHSPISTSRNYIVLLPLTSIIFAFVITSLNKVFNFKFIVLLIGLIGISNLTIATIFVKNKIEPLQNNNEAVKFIENNTPSLSNVYYLSREDSFLKEVEYQMAKFYFSDNIDIIPLTLDDDFYTPNIIEGNGDYSAIDNFYILMQHQSHDLDHLASEFKEEGIDLKIYIPQNNEKVVVVYYDKSIKD